MDATRSTTDFTPPNPLRLVRAFRGMTQRELAHRAGLDRNTVSALERNVNVPSMKTIVALSDALDWPIGALFFDRPERMPSHERKPSHA